MSATIRRGALCALDVYFDPDTRRACYIYAVEVSGFKGNGGGAHLLEAPDATSERNAWASALIEVGCRVVMLLRQLDKQVKLTIQGQRQDLAALLQLSSTDGLGEEQAQNVERFRAVVEEEGIVVRHRDAQILPREERLEAQRKMLVVFGGLMKQEQEVERGNSGT